MSAFLRRNSLSVFFLVLFVGALVGQSVAGFHDHNEQAVVVARLAGEMPETLSYWRYLTNPEFSRDVMENWQSEYLQFLLYILATVWLVQRGSSESKKQGEAGTESDSEQKVGRFADPDSPAAASGRGLITKLYSNSLLLVMGTIFVASWAAQSVTGWSAYNLEQSNYGEAGITWSAYLFSADFWERTLQNWQSEFLAVGSMAVFAIYFRQRGSPESKPVGESHESTGIEG